MDFQLEAVFKAMGMAIQYIPTTLFIAVTSLVIGTVVGLVIGLIRYYRVSVLAWLFDGLITLMKGIPIVLILLSVHLLVTRQFKVVTEALGINMAIRDFNMSWVAIFALSILATINSSEIFRGAFSAVRKGQFDAAKSLGMTTPQVIRRLLLPQALPIALPMLSSLLIALIKGSALASMVSVVDIFAAAKISAQQNYRFLEGYVGVALLYWGINLMIEWLTHRFEHRRNIRMKGVRSS